MEGLAVARILEELAPRLPARNLGWVFPDETTAAVLLEPESGGPPFNLVLAYRPPVPGLYTNRDRLGGEPGSPFQRTLASRARGPLVAARQLKLDRVVALEFGEAPGFVAAPPVRLVFELAGRNANLLLLEPEAEPFAGRILAVAREVTASRNRYREVRPGRAYAPPPPYEKLDPRSEPDLTAALADVPVAQWHRRVDGLGPVLTAKVARRAGVDVRAELTGTALERAVSALRSVAADPTAEGGGLSEEVRDRANVERAEELRRSLRGPLEKRRTLLSRQLGDVDRAREAAIEALADREKADTLLAHLREVPAGASSARLPNLYGEGEVEVPLEPALDAVGNANRLYARARRREEVMERLEEREPALRESLEEIEALLRQLETLDLPELARLARAEAGPREAKPAVGFRHRTRGGFEVLIGRNAKENDFLSFKAARSTDVWLHAQGYPGSHVILRSEGREVPFSDVLEAAGLAAYHSKARGSSNVPVDYTQAKFVWRPRGARAGAVHYTNQKTVFVDPQRPGEAEAG